MVAGMDVAAHAVFGREQGREGHAGSFMEYVDGTFEVVVDAGWVGNKAHTFALQLCEAAVAEHFDAGFDFGLCRHGSRHRQSQ